MPLADWFEAAESAISGLYTLFSDPGSLIEEILPKLSTTVKADGDVSQRTDPPVFRNRCFCDNRLDGRLYG